MKELYDQIAFFTHVILLDQAFAHCPRFPTAASQGSLGRVSVPVWLIILSDQLKIAGLVSSYPTNYLFLPRLILERSLSLIIRYSYCPSEEHSPHRNEDILIPDSRVNSQVLYTRSPLSLLRSYDLHVLSISLAFILSQDQTQNCRIQMDICIQRKKSFEVFSK
jgi:hypothetical protein